LKTAIYVRVSTEEQAKEGYSVSGQLEKLKAFCISQNWIVEDIYADEGISAKDTNRPELQRMLADIEENKIECVLVYRLDRLTRSVHDLYNMLEVFEENNCKFKSATEVYDTTTAMGRMFITIVAALAQWERENMGERISFGFEEKARQGKIPITYSPFGYTLNKKESKLYINKKEAKVVQTIFEKYIGGYGGNKVAKYLNDRKIYTKRGNQWSDDTVMKILRSHLHKGDFSWNGIVYKDAHDPIVSKETWYKAQELMVTRRKGKTFGKAVSSPYIFSGLLKCESCGTNLVGNYTAYARKDGTQVRNNYYRCRLKFDGKCNTKHYAVSEKRLEEAFLEIIKNWNFDYLVTDIDELKPVEEPDVSLTKKELQQDLKKLEELKIKWQYAWAEELIDHKDFKERMNEANTKIAEIEKELKTEKEETKRVLTKDKIINILKDIESQWHHLDALEKKNMLHEIIDEIKFERHRFPNSREHFVEITDIIFM